MNRPEAFAELHDVAALWAAGFEWPDMVVRAAGRALADGADGYWLAILAALPERGLHDGDVSELLERALAEAHVQYYPPGSRHAGEAALVVMARRAVAGAVRPHYLADWAHRAFSHDRLRSASPLAELSDAYCLIEYSSETAADIDELVMVEARRLVAGTQRYWYLGPSELRYQVSSATGAPIASDTVLTAWLSEQNASERGEPFTFTIDLNGRLRLAPRRSEHVACAGGADVLCAGEIRFEPSRGGWRVSDVSNHSTGYCPDLTSWPAVEAALDRAAIPHPGAFTSPVIFRACPACREINIVREDEYVCALCDGDLPSDWNVHEFASP
jgi:hypothetical protein